MITPRPLWLLPPVLTVTGIRNGLPRALTGQPYKLERSALFCSGKCPKAALHALTQHYVAGALAASSALTMSNQPRRGIAILLPASAVTSASFRASLSTRMPARSTSVSHIKGQTPVPARPKKPTLNTRVLTHRCFLLPLLLSAGAGRPRRCTRTRPVIHGTGTPRCQ